MRPDRRRPVPRFSQCTVQLLHLDERREFLYKHTARTQKQPRRHPSPHRKIWIYFTSHATDSTGTHARAQPCKLRWAGSTRPRYVRARSRSLGSLSLFDRCGCDDCGACMHGRLPPLATCLSSLESEDRRPTFRSGVLVCVNYNERADALSHVPRPCLLSGA